jgi:hypothetical protein
MTSKETSAEHIARMEAEDLVKYGPRQRCCDMYVNHCRCKGGTREWILKQVMSGEIAIPHKILATKPKDPVISTSGIGDSAISPHYKNEHGSLYLFAQRQDMNAWEFDACKRIIRSRKKGRFDEDIRKSIEVLEMYRIEHKPE